MDLPSSREALIWLLLSPINIAIRDFSSIKVFVLAKLMSFVLQGANLS